MTNNIDRFKNDLGNLIKQGAQLDAAMVYACSNTEEKTRLAKDKKTSLFISKLPIFEEKYQQWYSEALSLLQQVLPNRVADFIRYYEKPKGRKDITSENYRIEDYLQGITVTRGYPKQIVVNTASAIPQFRQQLAIVEAANARFESSLFDIRQLVHADLLDSELEAGEVLAKHKFTRAAGALTGVVLERHLSEVCSNRALPTGKKNPTIADFNEILKTSGVIDLPQWRFIQHLADIRNLCDHSRIAEPSKEQVDDLIEGTKKIIKSVF